MAKRISVETGLAGGIEGRLSGLGTFLLVLGIVGCIAAFIAAGLVTKENFYQGWAANGLSAAWIAISVASLIQGIAAFILCRGFAEAIRLLKKMAGLPYGGRISEPYAIKETACSECQAPVEFYDTKCGKCGAGFEEGSP